MISDSNIKEIRKKVSAGVPEGEIRKELTMDGYSQDDIAKVFAPQPYDMRSWYLFFGFLVLIIGIWQLLSRGGLLILILAGLLFWQYVREIKRLKKSGADKN